MDPEPNHSKKECFSVKGTRVGVLVKIESLHEFHKRPPLGKHHFSLQGIYCLSGEYSCGIYQNLERFPINLNFSFPFTS